MLSKTKQILLAGTTVFAVGSCATAPSSGVTHAPEDPQTQEFHDAEDGIQEQEVIGTDDSPFPFLHEFEEEKGFEAKSVNNFYSKWLFMDHSGPGKFVVKLTTSTSGSGYVYIRYRDDKDVVQKHLLRVSGSLQKEIALPYKASRIYVYARFSSSLSVRAWSEVASVPESTPTPSSTVRPGTTTDLISSKLKSLAEKGVVAQGSVRSMAGGRYQPTLRYGRLTGRIYEPTNYGKTAYIESPPLIYFLRENGEQVAGIPISDARNLRGKEHLGFYVQGTRGIFIFNRSKSQSIVLSALTASYYLRNISLLGLPVEKHGNIVVCEGGTFDIATKTVVLHADFQEPMSTYRISQSYLGRYKAPKLHTGVDFAARVGTPVYATANALVDDIASESTSGGWGNVVKLKHFAKWTSSRPMFSQYGHLSRSVVTKGQLVQKGDLIGYVGSTGFSTGPHLHFEMYDSRVQGFGHGYELYPSTLGYRNPLSVIANTDTYIQ